MIVCRSRAEEALTWLRWITEKLGLGLNEAKTRVCDAERESFDFLGYTFGPMVFRRTGKTYVGATPSRKRVKRSHAPLEEVVVAVNRKLQGWSRYFSVGTLEPAYRTVDRYTEALFRQFLVRRHKVPGRGTRPFREPVPLRVAWPRAVAGPPADVAPACLDVKPVREPDAGKPHVRFDERVRETESWTGY